MAAGIVVCVCGDGAGWTWHNKAEPLPTNRISATTVVDRRARDFDELFENIEK
jgi:hypothetical protein